MCSGRCCNWIIRTIRSSALFLRGSVGGIATWYKPLAMTSDPNRIYIVDARLKAGVSHQRAEAEMQPLLEQFASETPDHFPRGFRVHVTSLTSAVVGPFKGTLLLLFAAVAVFLAIGCAN